jgi:hypothetical protein
VVNLPDIEDSLLAGYRRRVTELPPEFGWIATISKPRLKASIKLTTWGDRIWSRP